MDLVIRICYNFHSWRHWRRGRFVWFTYQTSCHLSHTTCRGGTQRIILNENLGFVLVFLLVNAACRIENRTYSWVESVVKATTPKYNVIVFLTPFLLRWCIHTRRHSSHLINSPLYYTSWNEIDLGACDACRYNYLFVCVSKIQVNAMMSFRCLRESLGSNKRKWWQQCRSLRCLWMNRGIRLNTIGSFFSQSFSLSFYRCIFSAISLSLRICDAHVGHVVRMPEFLASWLFFSFYSSRNLF